MERKQQGGRRDYTFSVQNLKNIMMENRPIDKIELDSREREKTSFATLGRSIQLGSSGSGINITYSGEKEGGIEGSKSRRGSTKDFRLSSSPATPSKSRGMSPCQLLGEEDGLGTQLNTVRMRLEERRKKIEEEKQKMELVMARQREKVGQEAFLRAVAKGIKKAGHGHNEGSDMAKSEILELANKVGGGLEQQQQRRVRPFSLHLQSEGVTPNEVKTPDMEALDISRMSDSLYELQSDIQKLAVQQSQIQNLMKQSPPPQPPKSEQPFFISQQTSNQPFYISQPDPNPPPPPPPTQQPMSRQYFPSQQPSRRSWGPPQPVNYLPPNTYDSPRQTHFDPHPPIVYQRPTNPPYYDHNNQAYDAPYLDQYGRPYRDQWGNPVPIHPPTTIQQPAHQPMYAGYNPGLNQTFPPAQAPNNQYSNNHVSYNQGSQQFTQQPSQPTFNLPSKYSDSPVDNSHNSNQNSPYHRPILSRSSSLKRRELGNSPHRSSQTRNSSYNEGDNNNQEYLSLSNTTTEELNPQQVSFLTPSPAKSKDTRDTSPTPRVSLVPRRDESPHKPPPMSEKPSLSSTFLEQKRRQMEHHRNDNTVPTSSAGDNEEYQEEPEVEVMSRSTLETLNTMKTEDVKEKRESKGFVISFDDETPVKPKPTLKPRRVSKKSEELDESPSGLVGKPTVNIDPDLDFSLSSSSIKDRDQSPGFGKVKEFSMGEKCNVCDTEGDTEIIGGGRFRLCKICSDFLGQDGTQQSLAGGDIRLECLGGSNSCVLGGDIGTFCPSCFIQKIRELGVLEVDLNVSEDGPAGEADLEKKKEWVIMMSEKRRQQAEESRLKREEETRRKREEEVNKRDDAIRKKEDDKKRREDIFQQYKMKKEIDKAKDEGNHFFAAKPGPKLRPKSAGGLRPRPRTIHSEKDDDIGIQTGKLAMRGSQSNIITGLRGSTGEGGLKSRLRRGSNVSLTDEVDSTVFGSSLRGLGHIGRSKSSSASNLGPGSLPLGIRNRGGRDFDDNASDVSSTTSGYRSGRGSAKLFREPVCKSNRSIIMNAVEYVVFPGVVNKDTRSRVLEEIERCDCPHFLVLFRDSKLQFRGLYAYYPDTEEVFKIYGTGPRQVTDNMMDRFYKYNSGGKKFTQIHTKHLTVTIDGFAIHNQLWLGKKTKLPDKRDLKMII